MSALPFAERRTRALTRREAYGACLLGLLAALFLAQAIGARDEARRADLSRLRAERAVAADAGALPRWQARADTAHDRLQAWRSRAWQADTPGLAAAEATQSLTGILASSGLDGQATVEPEPSEIGGREALRFEVSLRSDDAGAPSRVLAALAAHRPNLVVTDLRLTLPERGGAVMEAQGFVPLGRPVRAGSAGGDGS